MNRVLILSTLALMTFALGCPKETSDSALPPAGLAGAPGAGKAAPVPTVPMPGATAPGATAPATGGGLSGMAAAGAATGMPAGHPSTTAPATKAPTSMPGAMGTVIPGTGPKPTANPVELAGTVAEAHHVKQYTYVLVKNADGESWAAVLKDDTIKVGTQLELGKEIWMEGFQSPSLNRTFDRILFGRLISKK